MGVTEGVEKRYSVIGNTMASRAERGPGKKKAITDPDEEAWPRTVPALKREIRVSVGYRIA